MHARVPATRIGLAVAIWLVLLTAYFAHSAYTMGVTGLPGAVGTGTAGVSGFTVTDVTYEPSPANARLLGSMRFEVDHPATRVIAIVGSTQLGCEVVDHHAVCDASAWTIRINSITNLSIIASA